MQKKCLTALIIALSASSLNNFSSCAKPKSNDDPYFPRQISSHFNPSIDEVIFHEDRLRDVSDRHVMDKLEGGILFDGVMVEKLSPDKLQHNRWKFKIQHVYYPTEGYKKRELIALTKPGPSGISLNPGSRYRVYVFDFGKYARANLKGPFSLWKGSYINIDAYKK